MVIRWLYDLSVVIRLDTWLYANRRGYTLQAAFQPKTLKIGITTPACSPNARFGPVEASYAWNWLSVDTKQSINQSIELITRTTVARRIGGAAMAQNRSQFCHLARP